MSMLYYGTGNIHMCKTSVCWRWGEGGKAYVFNAVPYDVHASQVEACSTRIFFFSFFFFLFFFIMCFGDVIFVVSV